MLKPFRFVKRINLGRHHDLRTQTQLWIVGSKLTVDNLVIVSRIAARGRRHVNQMKQHLGPLYMPQKTITESMAFMRAFDQTGNVRDHKSTKVARVNHAQVRLKRGKRIVGDFRPGG